ncbi:MAG TPA: hypothetical protein VFV87_19790 [Pirellulaceae bacterium]|nr:hypothetical protein [Pirellulaceae bacterium]
MNRLSAAPLPPVTATAAARVPRSQLRDVPPSGLTQCLLTPLHYERNYAYPLLVWLHSTGGDEREVRRVMPHISLRNYAALGVRGPGSEPSGYSWPQSPDMIASAEQTILESVSRARLRFNIHPDRIFLAGYEGAGTMALRIALRHPDRFAGAASLNGPFPTGQAPLAMLASARRLKLLSAHCRDSRSYPIERVCRELSLFHCAGMAITLRQYPCEDELTTQMLHDLDVWLMEQVTGALSGQEHPAAAPADWN